VTAILTVKANLLISGATSQGKLGMVSRDNPFDTKPKAKPCRKQLCPTWLDCVLWQSTSLHQVSHWGQASRSPNKRRLMSELGTVRRDCG